MMATAAYSPALRLMDIRQAVQQLANHGYNARREWLAEYDAGLCTNLTLRAESAA